MEDTVKIIIVLLSIIIGLVISLKAVLVIGGIFFVLFLIYEMIKEW